MHRAHQRLHLSRAATASDVEGSSLQVKRWRTYAIYNGRVHNLELKAASGRSKSRREHSPSGRSGQWV